MAANCHFAEAEFCCRNRNRYCAMDLRGFLAAERVNHLLKMRGWLLDRLMPKLLKSTAIGSHKEDIPIDNFVGVWSTERFVQLYNFTKSGSICARASRSQMNETFFSSFRGIDPRGEGVLKLEGLSKAMGIAESHYRMHMQHAQLEGAKTCPSG